ncbi:hypothetical protein [Cytobacillus gottheilii]|uniref:hypothetical protein n=1 Tax=Cytobacillus gottheilii TaxID=859144 RepID=UPI002494C5CE|nr:hypothetical protein [Cytobacillus gottheilii]
MKQKVLSIALGGFMLAAMLAPTIAEASSKVFYWSFDMDLRAVDGSRNGMYYDLNKGDIDVSGQIWPDKQGVNVRPVSVFVELWRDTLGADTYVGGRTVVPSSTVGTRTKFSFSADGQPADQYYLYFSKAEDDYWDLRGSGSILNDY